MNLKPNVQLGLSKERKKRFATFMIFIVVGFGVYEWVEIMALFLRLQLIVLHSYANIPAI